MELLLLAVHKSQSFAVELTHELAEVMIFCILQ